MKNAFNVYNNLWIMMEKYRELTMISERLSFDKFAQQLSYNENIVLRGKCDESNIRGAVDTHLVLIAHDSDYGLKSASFKDLLEKITFTNGNHLNNIVVITGEVVSSHLRKVIAKKQEDWAESGSKVYFESDIFDRFKNEIPNMIMFPTHTIVDISQILWDFYAEKSSLSEIHHDDAAAVWIGARPGMVIHVRSLSELATYADNYKHCTIKKIKL